MKYQKIKGKKELKLIQKEFHHVKYQSASAHHVGIQENRTEIFLLEAPSELKAQYRADWQMEEEIKKYSCV